MLGTFDLQIVVFLWLLFVFIVTIRRVLFRQTLETLKTSLNPAISKSKTHVWSISLAVSDGFLSAHMIDDLTIISTKPE